MSEKDKITILFEAVDKVTKVQDKILKKLDKIDKRQTKRIKGMKTEIALENKLAKDMKKGNFDWYKSMLPILFISQQVSQSLKSVIQPSNDLLGVQETYNDFLAAAFIPTATENLDAVIAFGSGLLSLSEDTRSAIGSTIRYGAVASDMVGGITEAALAGAGLKVNMGGLAGAVATGAVGLGILDDKTLTAQASIAGPLNTAILTSSIKIGEMRDIDIEASKAIGLIGSTAVDVGKAISTPSILDDFSATGKAAYAWWNFANNKLIEYKNNAIAANNMISNLPANTQRYTAVFSGTPTVSEMAKKINEITDIDVNRRTSGTPTINVPITIQGTGTQITPSLMDELTNKIRSALSKYSIVR